MAAADCVMPWGKHEGSTFAEIADKDFAYLEWLQEEMQDDPPRPGTRRYDLYEELVRFMIEEFEDERE